MHIRSHNIRFSQETRSTEEKTFAENLENFISDCDYSASEKMSNFPLFTPRQQLTRYLARYEIFKEILGIQGSVVECGVLFGGGLGLWAQLSAILEPINHQRHILGFDTFSGIPGTTKQDQAKGRSEEAKPGGFAVDSYAVIEQAVRLMDANRPIGHIPKVELVKGDACQTIPRYLVHNKHLLVALLFLDFDIYEPTRVAIEQFLPRMPKGAIVAFDELNLVSWPGETEAVIESLDIKKLELKRFSWGPTMCYAKVGS